MSQPPINPLKNMKIDYWYKALTVVGAALFVFNGTSFFDRYPVVPLGFLSSGIFYIGLGEWINHPLKVRFIGPGVWTRGYNRSSCALGIIFDILGCFLIVTGVVKFF
ncbi:hypothetical protein [Escherichia coli]|uniref:hypothetical protein n=1 Tax=Escherichia coli TaxID=562 RepID=UPI001FF590C6|nr:hypothetical protein [Escherichia coli]